MTEPNARLSATEFAKTHYKTPALVEHGIRCGKAICKCSGTYRHGPYAYLYWRDGPGTAHRIYVRQADVHQVREIIELRQAADRQRRRLMAESRGYLSELRNLGKAYGLW
ncbi:hypothetical protein BH23CHL5_BH23CHL5_23210 [soil metagenome]